MLILGSFILITSSNGAVSGFIIKTGGGGLILRPNLPVFRCHNPDLGRFPNRRFAFGLPKTTLECSGFET